MDQQQTARQLEFQSFIIFNILTAVMSCCEDTEASESLYAFDLPPSNIENDAKDQTHS